MYHKLILQLKLMAIFLPNGSSILTNMQNIQHGSHYEKPELLLPERYMNNIKTIYSLQNGRLEERDQFNFGWGR